MLGADPAHSDADNYRRFAHFEARGKSPLYEALCEGVAADTELLAFLERQPPAKRQPNLLLGAVRFLFGTQSDYGAFRACILEHREQIVKVLRARRTQTNEPGRCASLLPVLASLPEPLALLEVGAAAGLCLLPDRYGYDYRGQRVGCTEVVFPCMPHGPVPVPKRLPEVVWRAGIDLDPIDLSDKNAVDWLEALVWPEEQDRLERLRAAIAVARREPPRLMRGDLVELLPELAAQAPPEATLVVFHTAVLSYLSPLQREQFQREVGSLRAEWISNEGSDVVAGLPGPAVTPIAESHFLIAHNGCPVAFCDPHGRWIQWTAQAP